MEKYEEVRHSFWPYSNHRISISMTKSLIWGKWTFHYLIRKTIFWRYAFRYFISSFTHILSIFHKFIHSLFKNFFFRKKITLFLNIKLPFIYISNSFRNTCCTHECIRLWHIRTSSYILCINRMMEDSLFALTSISNAHKIICDFIVFSIGRSDKIIFEFWMPRIIKCQK